MKRRRWFRLRSLERDVDNEIASYFEESVRDLERRGWSGAAARQEAQRRFGDVHLYRGAMMTIDRSVEARMRWTWRLETAVDMLRQAVRSAVRAPGLSLGIVAAFALGIGANATMFETVERLLLRPPPHIADPAGVRRVLVDRAFLDRRVTTETLAYPDYLDFVRTSGFSHVAAYAASELTVGAGESARQVPALLVTANWWDLLGPRPALGRWFGADEDRPDAPRTAVLGYAYWQREYGGTPDVLGRAIDFGYGPYTVVGVAPRGFTGIDLRPVDLFLPFMAAGSDTQGGTEWVDQRGWYWLRAVARLAPGVALETAEAEATSHHRAGRAEDRNYDPQVRVVAAPLLLAQGPNAPSEAAVARWLLGVAGVVLLIACLNVANLLLARLIRQGREVSIRLALGVSRSRLIGQVLLEGLLLGLLGGAAALLLAWSGGTLVQRTLLPHVDWSGGPSPMLLALVFGLALLAGVLSAIVPAVQAGRRGVAEGLRTSSGGITRSTARVRATLSVVQAALSVVLLVGAGLFVRSLDRVRHGDFGLEPWDVAYIAPTFRVGSGITDDERREYMLRAAERLGALPGVAAAAATRGIPFWSAYAFALRVPGVDSLPRMSTGGPYGSMVTHGYFRTLGIRTVRGRVFDERDAAGAPPVIVVNESFARAAWPHEDALTKCVHVGDEDAPCAQVIGIVRDARRGNLIEDETHQYYLPVAQRHDNRARPDGLLLRIPGDMAPVLAAARAELLALDPRVRFVRARTLEELLAPQLRQWQLGATLFSLFGVLALIVAAIGLYSVLAFDVAQRMREIGLRTALGATSRAIVALVVTRAARITAAGVVIGTAAALVLAPRLADMLYQVGPRDPVTFLTVGLALGAVSLLAAGLPAWRAARVDPNVALRAE